MSDTKPENLSTPSLEEPTVKLQAKRVEEPGTSSGEIKASSINDSGLPQIPNYRLVGELGRGGMGVIYKAWDVKEKRYVALKMLLSSRQNSDRDRKRFLRESEAVLAIKHPNLVEILDVGEFESKLFFVMEFCTSGTLDKKLRGFPLSPINAAIIAEQLAHGIAEAHRAKIVHRDLKPSNVLLTDPGTASPECFGPFGIPKISDFGIAKQLDSTASLSRTGSVLGTPSYMAPEQALGRSEEVGPQTDIYALGAILYEMLTGRPPFRGLTGADTIDLILHSEPISPRLFQPKIPESLEAICLKCLRKNTKERYLTADELADDLGKFQRGEPGIVAKLPNGHSRSGLFGKTASKLLLGLLLLVVFLLGGIGWLSIKLVNTQEELRELRELKK